MSQVCDFRHAGKGGAATATLAARKFKRAHPRAQPGRKPRPPWSGCSAWPRDVGHSRANHGEVSCYPEVFDI